jgi:hypothetical protein
VSRVLRERQQARRTRLRRFTHVTGDRAARWTAPVPGPESLDGGGAGGVGDAGQRVICRSLFWRVLTDRAILVVLRPAQHAAQVQSRPPRIEGLLAATSPPVAHRAVFASSITVSIPSLSTSTSTRWEARPHVHLPSTLNS